MHIDLNQPELESVTHIVIMVPTANDKVCTSRGIQVRGYDYRLICTFLNQNIYCGYSKEPYVRTDGLKNIYDFIPTQNSSLFGIMLLLLLVFLI